MSIEIPGGVAVFQEEDDLTFRCDRCGGSIFTREKAGRFRVVTCGGRLGRHVIECTSSGYIKPVAEAEVDE